MFEVLSLAFSVDGTLLASGSRYSFHLTDVAGGEALIQMTTGDYPLALARTAGDWWLGRRPRLVPPT